MKQMLVVFINGNGQRIGYRGNLYACQRFFKAQCEAGNKIKIVKAWELK